MPRLNLEGKTFGELKVIEYSHTFKGKAFWRCICSCGNEAFVISNGLTSGHNKTCGIRKNHKMSESERKESRRKTTARYRATAKG